MFGSLTGVPTSVLWWQERDRLLCLAILSFVAIENLRDANRLYDEVQAQLKSRGLPPTGGEAQTRHTQARPMCLSGWLTENELAPPVLSCRSRVLCPAPLLRIRAADMRA